MSEVWNNATLTTRLKALEQAFYASRSREVDNTYRSEDALNKADALTPYTETKTAYIGDTSITFDNVPSGNLNVFFTNYFGIYRTEISGNRLVVSFEPLEEVTQVTISII